MTRVVIGDMAQPSEQIRASANLEVVLALTLSEVGWHQGLGFRV